MKKNFLRIEELPPQREKSSEQKIKKNIFIRIVEFYRVNKKILFSILICIFVFSSYEGIRMKIEEMNSSVIRKSQQNHKRYVEMSPDNLHLAWINSLNGFDKKKDLKNPETDAVVSFIGYLGGNFKCKDSVDFVEQINSYLRLQLAKTTYSLNGSDVKSGYIIIFKPTFINSKQVYKVGIIEEVIEGKIKYMEWDRKLKKNFPVVRMGDYSIQMIVELTHSIWSGLWLENAMKITRGMTFDHDGVDMKMGNPNCGVLSLTDGVVVKSYNGYDHQLRYADWNRGGNFCVIKTKINNEVRYVKYLHLLKSEVEVGQVIKKGKFLGEYGNVGFSTGVHVHVSLYDEKNNPVDPLPFLSSVASFIIFGYPDFKFEYKYFAARSLNSFTRI